MTEDEKKALAHSVAINALRGVGYREVVEQSFTDGCSMPELSEIEEIQAMLWKAKVEL